VRDGLRPQRRVGQVHLQEREIIGQAIARGDGTRQDGQDGHQSPHRIGPARPGGREGAGDGNGLPGGERS
jgi:hypothetical protein